MPQSIFGTGFLFGIPTPANPTPVRFGALQSVAADFSFDMKMLYGSNQFPLEQGRGKGKIDLKAEVGRVDAVLFNQIYFGLTNPAGEFKNSVDEAGTVPTTPFQVTVANSANFSRDLGVYDITAAKWLTRVASGPATGQYAVTAGVYTFAAADTTHQVQISYTYASAATGATITQTNTQMGSGPIFSVQLVENFRGKAFSLYFPAVQAAKLSMPLKLDDFELTSIDMNAQDDGAGNVFTMSMTG